MLTVMTFNLRYDNPRDGENAWPFRKEVVAALIRRLAPDLLGTQEGLAHQLEELLRLLPGYQSFGAGRGGSPGENEHGRVFYRTDTVRLGRHGDFWHSETPDVPGSISAAWGNTLPRMATWGEFEPADGGPRFTFLNTHLDHASEIARRRGAELITRFLARDDTIHPAIVVGDLNAPPGSDPLRILQGGAPAEVSRCVLRDACAPEAGCVDRPTFHGFTGEGAARIDYILVEPPIQVTRCEILNGQVEGRWPSDHFPVVATLVVG